MNIPETSALDGYDNVRELDPCHRVMLFEKSLAAVERQTIIPPFEITKHPRRSEKSEIASRSSDVERLPESAEDCYDRAMAALAYF